MSLQRCHDMASPSLHGVPRDGSPASAILWDAPTPRRPSRPVRCLHEPIPSCRPWFAPLGRGRPTGGQGVVGSGLPSGLTMETSGSLRFLGNPGGHCPCSSTPVGSGRLSGPRVSCLTRPPPVSTTKALGPSRNSAAVMSIWRETQRRDRSGEQSQSRSSGENHQGCLFPCLDPPSSRTSRLFLCLLPRERTECIDRSHRLDPAPRFDGWIGAPVFVWPRPLSFINA